MSEDLATAIQPISGQLEAILGFDRDLADVNAWQMALRAVLVYVLALVLVRLASKRWFSQAMAFDVIVAIMLGSILSRAINGSAPLFPTLLASAVLVAIHGLLAALAVRTSFLGPLVKGEPRLLIEDGKLNEEEMKKAGLSLHDIEQALRVQNGEEDLSRVARAYLERSGKISLIRIEKTPRVMDVTTEPGVQTVRIKLE